jgi:hypothetical protein
MKPEAVMTIFGLLSLLGFAVIAGRIVRSIWRWTWRRD